ncbi:MAG: DUF1343 domain-containing protein, partial [Pseudomonadota bacterium]
MRCPVRTGLARVLDGEVDVLRGKRLGLVVNHTAVDVDLYHIVDLLCSSSSSSSSSSKSAVGAVVAVAPSLAPSPVVSIAEGRSERLGFKIACLFGPEHGVRGDAQDMVGVNSTHDSVTGVPMYSLYGDTVESLYPRPEMLEGLDAVVFDIQDVGSRYYTYASTLLHMLEVCGRAGVEVVVLDRPNPINGVDVEGGLIRDGYGSFVGRYQVPNRHGMTVGELALFANDRAKLGCRLSIVGMVGWRRELFYDQTGLSWVSPSPNMPNLDSALVYPGMCLIEGTELSEGRGTTRPFEQVGAPYVSYAEA